MKPSSLIPILIGFITLHPVIGFGDESKIDDLDFIHMEECITTTENISFRHEVYPETKVNKLYECLNRLHVAIEIIEDHFIEEYSIAIKDFIRLNKPPFPDRSTIITKRCGNQNNDVDYKHLPWPSFCEDLSNGPLTARKKLWFSSTTISTWFNSSGSVDANICYPGGSTSSPVKDKYVNNDKSIADCIQAIRYVPEYYRIEREISHLVTESHIDN